MEHVFNVADTILKICRKKKIELTPMKLMKLVYIAHGWYLATREEDLFAERIEAWKYGPVIPDLYQATKKYGRSPIPFSAIGPDTDRVGKDVKSFLEEVCEKYDKYSGVQLSSLTHQSGTPWSDVYQDGVLNIEIPDGIIKSHYKALLNANQRAA